MFFTKKSERVEELANQLNEKVAELKQRLSDSVTPEDEKEKIRRKLAALEESVHQDTQECRKMKR